MKIKINNRQKLYVAPKWLENIVKQTFLLEGIKRTKAEISVLLVDDKEIKRINKLYLNRNCVTDVISFRMWEGPFSKLHPELLGDVVVNVQQAKRCGKDYRYELALYLVHGLLHILGYVDNTKKNTKMMQKRCDKILDNII